MNRTMTILVPLAMTFGETDADVEAFAVGWSCRIINGYRSKAMKPIEGRDVIPDANQTLRISWERGWMAADAACAVLLDEREK